MTTKRRWKTRWRVRIEFNPQDLWIGVYWRLRGLSIDTEFSELDV